MLKRTPHRSRIRRQEQLRTKRSDVRIGRRTRREHRAHDAKFVVLDRIEDAQPGVAGIARKQDHLDARLLGRCALVEGEQFAHQWKRDARRQDVVLARTLEISIRTYAIALEQCMAVFEVEQRTRGDRYNEVVGRFGIHAASIRHGAARCETDP